MGREHAEAYKSLGVKLVDVGKADIVSIASPDDTHAQYALEALKAGSHVFCEKPLCRKRQELGAILSCAKKKNLHVRQNFPLRHQPIFRQMKESISAYGDIYRVEASYNWGRTYKLYEDWRKEDADYSLVFGGLIHMLDLVTWMTGLKSKVVSVRSCNKSAPDFPGPDTVVAQCELENGGICTYTVDGGTGVDRHNHRLTVHGTQHGWTVVNHNPTDKRKAIIDFVEGIEKPELDACEVHAVELALDIDRRIV